MILKNIFYTVLLLMSVINFSCKNVNHIDKYRVSVDSFKTLPDGFYAYRHGRAYLEDVHAKNYRTWFDLDNTGNVESIFKIEDFKKRNADDTTIMSKYGIGTSGSKTIMQEFINLSRKYKFGNISIDRANKISFSYKDGLAEQYVMAFNDSVKSTYLQKSDFKLLDNGWFENIDK